MSSMPRSIRIEYPGAFYHVMARGNRREAIFADEDDRRFFLKTLGEACAMTGWRGHAWVLMSNHYHLLIETPEPNLVAGMQWLQNTYTRRFNLRHRLWGRLFGDRYKAVLVEGAGYYYETLLDYLHLNPVRAGLVDLRRGKSVLDYAWSSVAGGHALLPRRRPPWLATDEALAAFGCADTPAGRKRWVQRLDDRAHAEARAKCGMPAPEPERDARRSDLRRGWYWGSQAFAERILKVGEAVLKKPRHRSARASQEKRAHGEQEARRLLAEGLAVAGLSEAALKKLPGSDARKVAVARVVWEQTTVDMTWLAVHLHLRSAANASQQIRRHRQHPPPLSKALQRWILQSENVA
jgi:REP element-mobilizing transposase RayT